MIYNSMPSTNLRGVIEILTTFGDYEAQYRLSTIAFIQDSPLIVSQLLYGWRECSETQLRESAEF